MREGQRRAPVLGSCSEGAGGVRLQGAKRVRHSDWFRMFHDAVIKDPEFKLVLVIFFPCGGFPIQ